MITFGNRFGSPIENTATFLELTDTAIKFRNGRLTLGPINYRTIEGFVSAIPSGLHDWRKIIGGSLLVISDIGNIDEFESLSGKYL